MARKQSISVYGIFSSREAVENAIDLLRQNRFGPSDISALVPSGGALRPLSHEKHSKAPEGAAIGGGSGALLGGALGWLAGIGTLVIPGLGPFIAAGPIMGLLAGIGAGSVVGGITGALVGAGIPEYEAKRYERRLQDGGMLLSVHADDPAERERARAILEQAGAEDISSTNEGYSNPTVAQP